MVVTIHHDASDAGLQVLKQGGNAVDAAVAVGFALAVVFPQAGNIGGGGFMLIRMKSGDAHFVDYREKAPAAATADMYLDAQRNVVPGLSTLGYKAIGVPGTVAGLVYAEKTYGRLTLAKVMAPAIKLASKGYVLSDEEARSLTASKNLAQFPDSRRIFQRDGNFLPGDRFTQPELARTLERIAADPATFYKGAMAAELAASIQKGGGLITSADLAAYEVKDRTPLYGKYRDYDIVTAPPPSAGGIVLLEILNILSGYDLAHTGNGVADILSKTMQNVTAYDMSHAGDRTQQQVHLIVEAFRRAYMDRGDYLGDPDFVQMPVKQMLDPTYAAAWRKSIEPVAPTRPRPRSFAPPVFLPTPPAVQPARETHGHHPLLRRRRRGQRRREHLHAQRQLRLGRHREWLARLPAQQRDGRLHREARRAQHVRPYPKLGQRHRARQAPALQHDIVKRTVASPVYYTVNAGQVFRVRMNQTITSETARVGDQFATTIVDPVYANGVEVVPAGSVITGRVTTVNRASRKSKAGTIGVHFVSLRLPTGIARAINGELTDVTANDVTADNEGEVSGRSAMKRNVVFIGGGAATGALIGAIAGGGKGAGVGALIGGGLGAAGAVFSKGHEAEVKSGTEFGVVLNQTVSLPAANVR